MIQNGSLNFQVTNDNLGSDPAPNRVKDLHIRLRGQNGLTREYVYQEGDSVNLAIDDGGAYAGGGGTYPNDGDENLRIISARYGAGNRWIDVTNALQNLVNNNRLTAKVNDTNMGGNPAGDEHKELQVTWEYRGRRHDTRLREGDYLNLPDTEGSRNSDDSDLRIVSARYGAGSRWIDVTNALQNLVNNNRLSAKVNDTNMGGNPAGDRHKELQVTWEYQGRRHVNRLHEGDYLNLPGTAGDSSSNYSDLRIIRARYGTGSRWMDVTNALRHLVSNNRLNAKVNDKNMRGNPAGDEHKELQVTWEYQGRRHDTRLREGDYLNLPDSAGDSISNFSDLRIISARYGAGNRWIDVTDALQHLVNNDRLNAKVNDTNMGGNPAEGQDKELLFTWEYQGRRRETRLREGEYINIP